MTTEVVSPEQELSPNHQLVRDQFTEIIDNNYGAARELPNAAVKANKLGEVLVALAAGTLTGAEAAAQVQAAAEEAAG